MTTTVVHCGYWDITLLVMFPGVLYAAWVDFTEHRVPNWLNALIAALGIAAQTSYFGWNGLGWGLAGLNLGMALLIIPWFVHRMGAGDVKLLAAIGAWLGPWLVLLSFMAAVIVGAVLTCIIILTRGRQAANMGETGQYLPYGVPLAVGTITVFLIHYYGGSFDSG